VWREVDVMVVGAHSRAVAAALELQRQGRRVLVVSDLSYFGEESAGTLTCAPVYPAAVKRGLEVSLLEARVPFLYLARPVALLRDEDGRIGGAILAARTSLFAVRCQAIVDTTLHGVVFRLAGARAIPRAKVPQTVDWTVICSEAPAGATERPVAFTQGDATFRTFTVQAPRTRDPLSREHAVRASFVNGSMLATANLLRDVPDCDFAPVPDVHAEARTVVLRPVKPLVPAQGPYRFAPAFLRQAIGQLDASPADLPVLGRYDVVVAGGGTGGAPAGIAAAREGAKTLVLEVQHGLGGIGTLGLISSYWYGNRVGFTTELDAAVMELDAESRAKEGKRWNPEIKAAVLHRMLAEAGGTAWMGSYAFGVRMDGDRVTGLLVSTPCGTGLVETKGVVDATGNADIAAAAGAPCRVIGAEHVATQGTGLSPRASPAMRHRNSDHTFVDENDPEGITHAFVNARAKFADGFDTTPLVNTRERRQIHGDLEVSPLDLLAGRTFPDTIVTAISNFDTHGFIIHPVFMVAVPDHGALQAHVPFRCMLPKGIEGVLVTGLGTSAHRDALPVIRMQADVQNQGYAAGLAAALAGRGPLRGLDIRALQRRLAAIGILAPDVPSHTDSFPLLPAAIREAAGDLKVARNVAILFAHPEQSRPVLRAMPGAEAAMILGLQGFPEAAPSLAGFVREAPWDEGWNYRGMGQFGMCMSRMDVLILALARTRDASGVPVIGEKIRQLDAKAFFSHCRVAGIAAALLPDLAGAVADLLAVPGLSGYAQADSLAAVRRANVDPCETEARNLALRELYLAGGLYLAGDVQGRGRGILEQYAGDLCGVYARHARALLATNRSSLDLLELA
jgi:hypothetical protein